MKFLKVLILLGLFSNVACAGSVDPAVSGSTSDPTAEAQGVEVGGHMDLNALVYEGKDVNGTDCSLSIAAVEDEHEGEHSHELVAKLDYRVHGQAPVDTVVEFQNYNIDTNTYSPISEVTPGSNPAMVSVILNDDSIEVDYNKLDEYDNKFQLVQALRADFNNMDFESFEKALEEVLEGESSFEDSKAALDQLDKTILKVYHHGHYDTGVCFGFKLKEMKTVEFELGSSEEEGDDHGDHDHDDDHDDHDEEETDHDHDH